MLWCFMRSKILIGTRIQLFLFISLGVTSLHALFAGEMREVWVLFGVNFATLLNMFLIIFVVEKLLFDSKSSKTKGLLAGVFVAKTIILLLAFMVGVHFVGNKIILAVINYAVQIIILIIFLYNYCYKASGIENK